MTSRFVYIIINIMRETSVKLCVLVEMLINVAMLFITTAIWHVLQQTCVFDVTVGTLICSFSLKMTLNRRSVRNYVRSATEIKRNGFCRGRGFVKWVFRVKAPQCTSSLSTSSGSTSMPSALTRHSSGQNFLVSKSPFPGHPYNGVI